MSDTYRSVTNYTADEFPLCVPGEAGAVTHAAWKSRFLAIRLRELSAENIELGCLDIEVAALLARINLRFGIL